MPTSPQRKPLTRGQKVGAGVGAAGAITAAMVAFVAHWEGTEYTPYRDIVGVLTVCEGITGPHVIPGKTYTRKECDALLSGELEKHGAGLMACVTRPLTEPQRVALFSFTYNVGVGAACGSTLVRRLNAGEPASAWCPELMRWNRAGGREVAGLTNRRKAELALCLT